MDEIFSMYQKCIDPPSELFLRRLSFNLHFVQHEQRLRGMMMTSLARSFFPPSMCLLLISNSNSVTIGENSGIHPRDEVSGKNYHFGINANINLHHSISHISMKLGSRSRDLVPLFNFHSPDIPSNPFPHSPSITAHDFRLTTPKFRPSRHMVPKLLIMTSHREKRNQNGIPQSKFHWDQPKVYTRIEPARTFFDVGKAHFKKKLMYNKAQIFV